MVVAAQRCWWSGGGCWTERDRRGTERRAEERERSARAMAQSSSSLRSWSGQIEKREAGGSGERAEERDSYGGAGVVMTGDPGAGEKCR
ncbi:hypothetical protein M0R45_019439 [Rubus argutus]|uniref:Uncharacterized protein n=1 Tax=Rubus argutus TaxID=59490 RepID=A0AAW1X8Y2_RUBAR